MNIQLTLFTAVFLTLILFFFSIVESCTSRLSRLTLRVLAERERDRLLEEMVKNYSQFLLPLQFGIQILQVSVAILIAATLTAQGVERPLIFSLLLMFGVIVLFRQIIPKLVTNRDPERTLLRILPLFSALYGLLRWISTPLAVFLSWIQSRHREVPPDDEEEATEEEIQAYIGVGEEEGIFERGETELIQSALEFGDTLVREIMTPRTEIVAIEENATLSQLRNLIVSTKHSRVPVYRETLDQIVGVVYVRNLLAHLEEGRGDEPITPLINEAWIVPETKRLSDLLKEMQAEAEHVAIAINEYGAVSGLVSLEDVVEEIVGEIRDEDELERQDLIYEGEQNYIVRGGVEISELEEALGVDLGRPDVATVSGLVVAHLGRVPLPGESFRINGMAVEILSSDRRKIHTMRIRKLAHGEVDLLEQREHSGEPAG